MNTTISNSSPVQVQGPVDAAPSPTTTQKVALANQADEEVHNQSGDSTDSLKENNRSSLNSFLNDSANTVKSVVSASQQPLSALPTRFSTDNHQQKQLQHDSLQQPTCSDTSLNQSSDEESFADCPTFNSPLVNKILNVGDGIGGTTTTTGQARQSLGLDALIRTMGKVVINRNDDSIGANTTVDVAELAAANETLELIPTEPEELETINKTSENLNDALVEEEEQACDDVEMMSIVVEQGGALEDEDFANVALPEEGELAEPEEEVDNQPSVPLVEDHIDPLAENEPSPEVVNNYVAETAELNATAASDEQMDVEYSFSQEVDLPVQENINAEVQVKQEQISLSSIANLSQDNLQSPPMPEETTIKREIESRSAEIKRENATDFKLPTVLRKSLPSQPAAFVDNPFDGTPTGVVDSKQELFFSSKEFDFLQNKETANSLSSAIKDSVLLRFDPLINQPVVVVGQSETANVQRSSPRDDGQQDHSVTRDEELVPSCQDSTSERLQEEEEEQDSLLEVFGVVRSQSSGQTKDSVVNSDRSRQATEAEKRRNDNQKCPITKLVDVTMSLVDVINDSNLSATTPGGLSLNHNNSSLNNASATTNLSNIQFEDLETSKTDPRYLNTNMSVEGPGQPQYHQHNSSNGELKIRNERYDDMDRKLKEMEEREEVLLKRISEKDKQIGKMSKIVEEYERSMAELMKERAVTKDEYEKRCMDLEAERNANYQHLSSLESTFSDLHVKYERSKQLIESLKRSEETLLADKKLSGETAAAQEIRYEKLKMHAMAQMEVANKRLADESAQSTMEISRLKALLKKEEITRCSLQEQLNQKTRENEELIKIWDELKSDR